MLIDEMKSRKRISFRYQNVRTELEHRITIQAKVKNVNLFGIFFKAASPMSATKENTMSAIEKRDRKKLGKPDTSG